MAMILLMTLAYSVATFEGKWIRQMGIANYIARPKESGRQRQRHSHFYVGLYARAWVNFEESCRDLVSALLRLAPGKRPFYQRGLRGMELIRSTL
jgi:hypothetical protein